MDPDFDKKFPGWRGPAVAPDLEAQAGWSPTPQPSRPIDDDPYAEIRPAD